MKKPLHIFGAGGLGREINAMIKNYGEWQVVGFFDDALKPGLSVDGIPCLGGVEDLRNYREQLNIVIAIGNPVVKLKLIETLSGNQKLHFPALIHPSAQLMDQSSISLDEGCIITAGCILTTKIQVGKHVLININSTIGHDVNLGVASSIMPGVNIAGNVTIGKGVFVGSGACILNGLRVDDGAIIGSGAVVTTHVKSGSTMIGIPAKSAI